MLTGEQAAHAKVLRLSPGETVTLCDGAGWESRAAVEGWESGGLRLLLEPPAPSRAEPKLRVSVYMGFPKADKLEHVIQKATELGAYEVVAFPVPEASPGRMRSPWPRSWTGGRKSPPPPPNRAAGAAFPRC